LEFVSYLLYIPLMNSFIIASTDKKRIEEKINEIVKKNQAIVSEFKLKTIEDARELKELTKLSHQQKLAVIIKELEKASLPALNAILKNIEEPGPNIIFIITTRNIKSVIPTVISRCQIIKLTSKREENKDINPEYLAFLNKKKGLQLLYVDKIKKREEALEFLEGLIQFCEKSIYQKERDTKILRCLIHANQALLAIKSNANVKLQLTRMVINL